MLARDTCAGQAAVDFVSKGRCHSRVIRVDSFDRT
jgi:hypothetical protein